MINRPYGATGRTDSEGPQWAMRTEPATLLVCDCARARLNYFPKKNTHLSEWTRKEERRRTDKSQQNLVECGSPERCWSMPHFNPLWGTLGYFLYRKKLFHLSN